LQCLTAMNTQPSPPCSHYVGMHTQNVWSVRNGVSLLLNNYTGLGGYPAQIHHDLRAHICLWCTWPWLFLPCVGANLDRKSKFYIPNVVVYPRLDLYVVSVSTYTHDVTPHRAGKSNHWMGETCQGAHQVAQMKRICTYCFLASLSHFLSTDNGCCCVIGVCMKWTTSFIQSHGWCSWVTHDSKTRWGCSGGLSSWLCKPAQSYPMMHKCMQTG